MRDFRDSKTMAKALRRGLAGEGLEVTHSQSLELIAQAFGLDNWNILAAQIEAAKPAAAERRGDEPLHCSFCAKSQHDVQLLIAGPHSFICNDCVAICDDVVEDSEVLRLMRDETAGKEGAAEALAAYLAARSDEQLAAYLTRAETAAEAGRQLIAGFDGAAELPPHFRDMDREGRTRNRSRVARKLAEQVSSIELVASVVAARG